MKIKTLLVSILLVSATSIYSMGMTPQEKLFKGSEKGDVKLVEEALKEGADVNLKDKYANTALMIVTLCGNTDIVQKLIESGADVNLQNKIGETTLIWAIYYGYDNIVKKLIEAKANVDLQDKSFGNTALMYAADFGYNGIVKQLLDAGADVYIKNKKGNTAIDIAKEKKYPEIVKLLEEHLKQQKAAIKQHLPLPGVLQDITAKYLGVPIKEKAIEK